MDNNIISIIKLIEIITTEVINVANNKIKEYKKFQEDKAIQKENRKKI
jgi:hypothetical protein